MRLSRVLAAPILAAGLAALAVAVWPSIADRLLRLAVERLDDETGLVWTIGAVDFGLGPDLALHDLTARTKGAASASPPLLSIREAKLSGDLSAWSGAAGAWRASLADVAVELPRHVSLAAPLSMATALARPIPHLAAFAATATGIEIDERDTTATTARARGLELSGALAPDAKKTDISFALKTESRLASLGFSWPPADGIAKLLIAPNAPTGQRVEATGKLVFDAPRLRLQEVSGTAGDAPFSAEASLDLATQPSLDASIRVGRMILTDDSPGSPLWTPKEARNGAHVVTTSDLEKIDPRALDGFRLALAIAIEDLRIGRLRLGGVTTRTSAADRLVDVALDAKSFYDGVLRGRYTLAPRGESALLHQLSLSLANARVSRLLADTGGPRALDGAATARIELQTSGASLAAALRAADGRAEISLADGRVTAAGIGKTLDFPFASALLGALDDGSLTRFRRFGGSFAIKNGTAASNDLKFESKLVHASGAGRADLAEGKVDFTFDARLSLAGKTIKAPIRVFGPWAAPSVDADLGGAIGSSIDALGDGDIGGMLDSLFSDGGGNGTLGRRRSGR